MRRRLAAALPPLLACLAGCARYSEFQLPSVARGETAAGAWVWEPRADPVLRRGEAGQWDHVDALNPSVIRHDGRWLNLYSGFDGAVWHSGAAVSADGLLWEKRGRVLSPPSAEAYIAANGSLLHTGKEFFYWYQAGRLPRIELARSPDGRAWTRHGGGPVIPTGPRGSWDERGVADPYVVRFGGMFYCYYLGQDRARRQRLGVARSPDGIQWTKLRSNPVLELGEPGAFDENGLGEPAVWFAQGAYWMLYTGRARDETRRMGMARSADGVRWTKLSAPVISGTAEWNRAVVCDATVWPHAEGVHVWFGGGNLASPDERLNGQIGYGILRWRPAPEPR